MTNHVIRGFHTISWFTKSHPYGRSGAQLRWLVVLKDASALV
jgi:hypothetical protein